jgi:hypothetical protein
MCIALSYAFDSYGGDGSLLGGLVFAFLPLLIALAFVLPASLIIGLPTSALLARLKKESKGAYVGIGLIAGFLLPFPVLSYNHAEDLVWITLFGAFSGAMTGRTWWTLARESVAWQESDDWPPSP